MKRLQFIETTGKAAMIATAAPAFLLDACSQRGALSALTTPPYFTTNTPLSSPLYPAGNVWNMPIPANAQVDPQSDAILRFHSGNDLTAFSRVECAMPYNVDNTNKATIPFINIIAKDPGEDDPVTKSFPYIKGMVFQNGPWPNNPDDPGHGRDHHLIVIDQGKNYLYEIYQLRQQADDTWIHEGAAFFDLNNNTPRATGFQDSADAAGFPILAGLLKFDELKSGLIPHALRMTLSGSLAGYISPATHGTKTTPYTVPPGAAPMGARFRLKSTINEADFDDFRKPIITCLKSYGAFVGDNGTPFAFTADNNDDAYRNILQGQFFGPDAHAGDDASFILQNKAGVRVMAGDFELLTMGSVTPLPY